MSDSVFPYFIVNGLPVGITGLLIASIFAAGMSTISTSLNSGATVILNDFYKRYTKRKIEEKRSVKVLYIASAAICIIGVMISFLIIRVESALDIWWNLAGIFSGGMLGLFLLGYFSKKVTNVPAMIGVALGLLVIIWMSLITSLLFRLFARISKSTSQLFDNRDRNTRNFSYRVFLVTDQRDKK